MEDFGELFVSGADAAVTIRASPSGNDCCCSVPVSCWEDSFVDVRRQGRRAGSPFSLPKFDARQIFVRASSSQCRHLVIEQAFTGLRDLQVRCVYLLDADGSFLISRLAV